MYIALFGAQVKHTRCSRFGAQNSTLTFKEHLDKPCNFSHCKIEQVLSCCDSYTLELSLLALKAATSSESCP